MAGRTTTFTSATARKEMNEEPTVAARAVTRRSPEEDSREILMKHDDTSTMNCGPFSPRGTRTTATVTATATATTGLSRFVLWVSLLMPLPSLLFLLYHEDDAVAHGDVPFVAVADPLNHWYGHRCIFSSAILLVAANSTRLVATWLLLLRNQNRTQNSRSIQPSALSAAAISMIRVIAIASNVILTLTTTTTTVIAGHFENNERMHFFLIRILYLEWIAHSFLISFVATNLGQAALTPSTSSSNTHRSNSTSHHPTNRALLMTLRTMATLCCVATWWFLMLALGNQRSNNSGKRVLTFGKEQDLQQQKNYTCPQQQQGGCARCAFPFYLCGAFNIHGGTLTLLPTIFNMVQPETTRQALLYLPILSSCLELICNIWLLQLHCVHDTVMFINDNDAADAQSCQDKESRSFMNIIWSASSDVFIVCSQPHDSNHPVVVNARINPAFIKLLNLDPTQLGIGEDDNRDISLWVEIIPDLQVCHVTAMDLCSPGSGQDSSRFRKPMTFSLSSSNQEEQAINLSIEEVNIRRVAQLALDVCTTPKKMAGVQTLMKRQQQRAVGGQQPQQNSNEVKCEVVSTLQGPDTHLITLRDITARLQRFELEKQLVANVTARKKDTEANRFTRHEIKNGILAAIGLLDHLQDVKDRNQISNFSLPVKQITSSLSSHESSSGEKSSQGSSETEGFSFTELGSTLRDIMDVILDEAMAREIVHGEYKPKTERIDVPDVLNSLRLRTSRRFPLHVAPEPFPLLVMDRQLLRYIYRNAVSNACKYGKPNGPVDASIKYNAGSQQFTLQVINTPGDGHDVLTKLSPDEVAAVFQRETQLEATHAIKQQVAIAAAPHVIRRQSSGNGAWIMQKCAEAMGGKCSIRFEETRTTFQFSCKLASFTVVEARQGIGAAESFCLPSGTWGIVIDDSLIQRKLMNRFFSLIGIPKTRRLILGATPEEVFGFVQTVTDTMEANPDDKFLVIADENIDILDVTVSGSLSVETLLSQLDSTAEARLLALIRSANDSDNDIAVYMARAHGYLKKEPIKKDKVLDLIQPWWTQRFSSCTRNSAKDDGTWPNESGQSSFGTFVDDGYGMVADDIHKELNMVAALAAVASEARWHPIREKLHTLKGDLMATIQTIDRSTVMTQIDALLECHRLPPHLWATWQGIQEEIEGCFAKQSIMMNEHDQGNSASSRSFKGLHLSTKSATSTMGSHKEAFTFNTGAA